MKKYLTLAAVVAAVAIIGVSFLAQAEPQTGAVETAVEKAADAAPAVDAAAKIKADCEAAATGADEAAKAAAAAKCIEEASAAKAEEAPAAAEGEKAAE